MYITACLSLKKSRLLTLGCFFSSTAACNFFGGKTVNLKFNSSNSTGFKSTLLRHNPICLKNTEHSISALRSSRFVRSRCFGFNSKKLRLALDLYIFIIFGNVEYCTDFEGDVFGVVSLISNSLSLPSSSLFSSLSSSSSSSSTAKTPLSLLARLLVVG